MLRTSRHTRATVARIATVARRTAYTALGMFALCLYAPVLGLLVACAGSLTHTITPDHGQAIVEFGCDFARATIDYAAGCGRP